MRDPTQDLSLVKPIVYNFFWLITTQEDEAFHQKQKDDKKALEEMKKKAAQKGPLSKSFIYLFTLN